MGGVRSPKRHPALPALGERMKARTARKFLPLIIPVLSVAAVAIVYIQLSCIDGVTACGNVSAMLAAQQPPQSAFQSFTNLWSVG
jgi:hypothetical protein